MKQVRKLSSPVPLFCKVHCITMLYLKQLLHVEQGSEIVLKIKGSEEVPKNIQFK
jgi:hypothetical protein